MKHVNTLLTLSILALTMLSCRKEEINTPQKGSVEFTFSLTEQLKSASVDLSLNPTAVIVSVEDLAGNSVVKNEKVSIDQASEIYNTKPLSFEAGTYLLTKFLVVDESGNVLNATPMGYSSGANLVESPLPIKFTVQIGYVTRLSPSIVTTQSKNPQELGYSTFNINQEGLINFQMGIYIFNSEKRQFEITDATLSITSDAGESINQNLAAFTDTINLKEANKYIITVSKDGYQSWTDTVSANDLLHYYTSRFAITLDKTDESSFSFVTKQDTLTRLAITVKNSDYSTPMRINWGDGTIEVSNANCKLTHDYRAMGTYKPRFTGNIGNVTSLTLSHGQIASINLEKATSLSSIDISRNPWLKTLNLSSMHQLKEVICVQGGIENLNLSNSENIELVHCSLNNLTNLDVSSLPKLKSLFCDRNNLTTLDIKNNPNLKVLYSYQNNLSSIDITSNSALETLDCRNNKLTLIDVTKSSNLTNVLLGNNLINNNDANKVLVDLLNNVKLNPRAGQISLAVSVKDGGAAAKEDLENKYQWTVSTN